MEHITIDFQFKSNKPGFGEFFKIVGYDNPNFSSSDDTFLQFEELGIEQIDDFFGIYNQEEEGDDVILWIYPLIKDKEVYHHKGPFDGIRVQYNILRNREDNIKFVEQVFNAFRIFLDVTAKAEGKFIEDFSPVEKMIKTGIQHWKDEGIMPGSDDALMYEEE